MARRRTISRGSSGGSKGNARSRSTKGSGSSRGGSRGKSQGGKSPSPWQGLASLLRVEGLGIVFLAMAVLTFLSFLSPNQGTVTSAWLLLLRQGFGWGAYLMPIGFGALGLGLLMAGFGRLPSIRWERVASIALISTVVLGLTHLYMSKADPWMLVLEGRGGGLLGWTVAQGLEYAMGRVGAYVFGLALLVIGILLFMGRSVADLGMVLWIGWSWLQGEWEAWQAERARRQVRREADYPVIGDPEPRGSYAFPRAQPQVNAPAYAPSIRVIGQDPQPAPVPKAVVPPVLARPGSKPTHTIWRLPAVAEVLADLTEQEISQAEIQGQVQIIEKTLDSLGVPARVVEVNQGPVITQFGVEPGFITGRGGRQTKVKVSRISSLADDLALALAAAPIRIEAPVPGRSIVGIEVPNKEVALVSLRGVMETETFENIHRKTPLPIALGENVSGEAAVTNLISMPHLLIAGATGSGKSVCINAIIACMLCTNTPETLRMIMVDPKRVELTGYNGIPHLLAPVVVDLERVVATLQWVTREMDQRYQQFAKAGARNIEDYNRRSVAGEQERLPYIVVFIDELADLMMIAPDEVERSICRIAQMARATGIHLIIATQRPSVDVVTGLIKANFPARISFMVTSSVDSRVIIDTVGAERLLGSGDMLFMSPDASQTVRLQGCYVSPSELDKLVDFWRRQAAEREGGLPVDAGAEFVQTALPVFQEIEEPEGESLPGQGDELLDRAIDLIHQEGKASTTLLQRRLRIGYARAARIIEALEEEGIVGPDQGGSRGREVLGSEDS